MDGIKLEDIDNPFSDIWAEVPRPFMPSRLGEVARRQFTTIFRNPAQYLVRYIGIAVLTTFISASYAELQNDPYLESQTTFKVGLISMVVGTTVGISNPVLELFQKTRPIFFHERRQQLYGSTDYFLALVLVELSMFVIIPGLFFTGMMYWAGSMNPDASRVGLGLTFGVMSTAVGSSFFTTLGLATPNMGVAMPIMAVATLVYQMFQGYLVRNKDIAKWIRWVSVLVPTDYTFHGWVENEFAGVEIDCDESGGDDCMQGDDIVEYWGADMHPSNKWGDAIVLLGFIITQFAIGGAVLGVLGEQLRKAK